MKNNPTRIQRKRTKCWRMPENTVYVGRGTEWGNPFVIGRDGTAKECIEKYLDHVMPYRDRGKNIGMAKPYLWEMSLAYIREKLRGKNLACWCALDRPCHADVLLEIANGGNL